MMKLVIPIFAFVSVAGAGAFALSAGTTPSESRADCPGQVVCPLSGELVCEDLCPLTIGDTQSPVLISASALPASVGLDSPRPDCSGLIVCPLTVDPVCKDECPLGGRATPAAEKVSEPATPACCVVTN